MTLKKNIIITDIGSTTTKAILLQKSESRYRIVAQSSSFTTVEKPNEDVNIGIYNSLKKLESQTNLKIIDSDSSHNLKICDEYTYLTTSSAGGGLQILVIGLTHVDSASSAKRVVYGAGGVVVNALSIDDDRTYLERLQILNTSRPDIILFCGGIDGGAANGVYRLGINLKQANIRQKFTENGNIPLVYAGNKDAQSFVKSSLSDKFSLHIIDNIRPTIREEKIEHAKDVIHDLFLNNVMEIAPGYSFVKKIVEADILPTPVGVLNTIKLLGEKFNKILAFDMGGATTDVYTYIQGEHKRSVCANYGMSYSAGNILLDSNYDNDFEPYIMAILGIKSKKKTKFTQENHKSLGSSVSYVGTRSSKRILSKESNPCLVEERNSSEILHAVQNDRIIIQNDNEFSKLTLYKEYFLNYIGNKVLYPDYNPKNDFELYIEHILAIKGIKLSINTHFENHYRTRATYFDQLANYVQNLKYYYYKIISNSYKSISKPISTGSLYYPLYRH